MTVEDICKRLEAGESDKDIAAELVNMLNQALDLKTKRDQEAQAKAKQEAERKTAAQGVVDSINAYFQKYYDCDAALSTEDMETFESILKNLKVEVIDEPYKKGIKVKTHSGGAGFNPDEIISDFLDAFRLK